MFAAGDTDAACLQRPLDAFPGERPMQPPNAPSGKLPYRHDDSDVRTVGCVTATICDVSKRPSAGGRKAVQHLWKTRWRSALENTGHRSLHEQTCAHAGKDDTEAGCVSAGSGHVWVCARTYVT